MASLLYVTEYAGLAPSPNNRGQVPMEPPLATQVVNYGGGATASSAFNANTQIVRLHTDSICSFLFSTAGTAAQTTDSRMVAGQTEYHGVVRGGAFKVSAVINT